MELPDNGGDVLEGMRRRLRSAACDEAVIEASCDAIVRAVRFTVELMKVHGRPPGTETLVKLLLEATDMVVEALSDGRS
jgi:hypothetical protein